MPGTGAVRLGGKAVCAIAGMGAMAMKNVMTVADMARSVFS